jgi:hypothetical protein
VIKINERINYFYLQGSPGIPSLNRTLQEEENGTMAGFTENDFKWICNSFIIIHSFMLSCHFTCYHSNIIEDLLKNWIE